MKEQFVPYEIALKLKEKGFVELCFAFYEADGEFKFNNGTLTFDGKWVSANKNNIDYCTAPLYQQVIDWFRVVHKIYILEQVTIDLHGDVYYGVVKKKGKVYRNTEISENPIKAKQFVIEYALTLI